MAHDLQRREGALLLCEEGISGREDVLEEEEGAARPQHAPHLVRARVRVRVGVRVRVRVRARARVRARQCSTR